MESTRNKEHYCGLGKQLAQNVLRVTGELTPNAAYEHIPNGRNNAGRARERWKDKHPLRRNNPGMAYALLLLLMMMNQLRR
jgi:hypothetical protein